MTTTALMSTVDLDSDVEMASGSIHVLYDVDCEPGLTCRDGIDKHNCVLC